MSATRLWQDAAAFAARAHAGQVRRDGRTPYFSHAARVALIVALEYGCTDETVVAAALLHDVLEDTTADYDDLAAGFGAPVADLVACLSKDKRLAEPQREQAYDRRLADGPWQARMIKLADVTDNLADVKGAAATLRVLDRARRAVALAGDEPALAAAAAAVRRRIAEVQRAIDSSEGNR